MDDDADPSDALAITLAGELRVIAGKLKRRLREQGSLGDLTPSQVSVLARLERDGPATVSLLARAEGMRPQSMGTIAADLGAAGLVTRLPDPDDGRQVLLSLTDACRDRIAAARNARQDWLTRAILVELTPSEQGQLATGLALIARIIEL